MTDTLEIMANRDKDGPKPTNAERLAILTEHDHIDERIYDGQYDDRNETKGLGWVDLYKWLGY